MPNIIIIIIVISFDGKKGKVPCKQSVLQIPHVLNLSCQQALCLHWLAKFSIILDAPINYTVYTRKNGQFKY